jgi:fumarate hydratase class I
MADADFDYTEMFPVGPDETNYRLVSTDGVSSFVTPEGTFLKVDPEAIRKLTAEAMRDIAHFLRTSHLEQLRKILDDPEASDNDRFVALDLLKNAAIAAGGVLPMCQDTGTAIVKGKKGEYVFTGGGDEEQIARGIADTYLTTNLRYRPKRTPARISQQRSRSMQSMARSTSSSSWPKVEARPTRVFCSKRPRPC